MYVNNYKNKLENNFGLKIVEARLITKDELIELGCIENSNSCSEAPDWVYSTSYWSGTAYDSDSVLFVYSTGFFYFDNYSSNGNYGVRPVINLKI